MLLALSLLITLAAVWYLLAPHRTTEAALTELHDPRASDESERNAQLLEDLELDYRTQKIDDVDYQRLKATLDS